MSESKKADNVDLNILIGNCKNTYECIQMLLPIEEDALKLVSTMLNEASLPAGLWIIGDTFIYQLSAKNTNLGKISNFVTNRYGESWDSSCEKSSKSQSRTSESQLKKKNKSEIEKGWASM